MLRWIRGKTRKDHVRKQVLQEVGKVCQMSTFLRQKILNWYGHIRRGEKDNLSRKLMDMVVPGKRRSDPYAVMMTLRNSPFKILHLKLKYPECAKRQPHLMVLIYAYGVQL